MFFFQFDKKKLEIVTKNIDKTKEFTKEVSIRPEVVILEV